eukprot:4591618-Amphidinium_carterae.1
MGTKLVRQTAGLHRSGDQTIKDFNQMFAHLLRDTLGSKIYDGVIIFAPAGKSHRHCFPRPSNFPENAAVLWRDQTWA